MGRKVHPAKRVFGNYLFSCSGISHQPGYGTVKEISAGVTGGR
jgi:hypothetical protein